jgi:AraC-like DNA-binding protein
VARAHHTVAETQRLTAHKRGLLREAHQLRREALSEFIRYRTELILTHLSMMPQPIRQVVTAVGGALPQPPTLMMIGRRVGRSPWHLNVYFRQTTGVTIHEFATCLRIRRSLRLVEKGVKIEAIASELGYRSTKTFYRHFDRVFAMQPTEVRRATVADSLEPECPRLSASELYRVMRMPREKVCHGAAAEGGGASSGPTSVLNRGN